MTMPRLFHGRITLSVAIILVCSIFLSLCGCGDKYQNVTIDIESLASEINSKVKFDDTLIKLNEDVVKVKYPSLVGAEKSVIYAGSGATAEEIIVLEFSDGRAAEDFSDKIDEHLSDMKETFKDYNAAEMPKLDAAVKVIRGKYLIYCVSCDASAVNGIVDSFFDK